ncbi:MAG: hypothetical protein ACP5Q5_07980 [Brevinematia bacterium]
MKKVLETIKKVELELQEEIEKSDKEVNQIISNAQNKIKMLEEDFKNKFEVEKKLMLEELNKDIENFKKERMNSFQKELDDKMRLFNEKKDIIKEKIIKLIFEK